MSKTDDMRRARETTSARATSDLDELDREAGGDARPSADVWPKPSPTRKPYAEEMDEQLETEFVKGRTRFLTIRLSAEEVESICRGWMRQTGTPTGPAKPLRVWVREILLQAVA